MGARLQAAKEEWYRFAGTTTFHGVNHFAAAAHAALQVFWGALLLACTVFIIFYISLLVKKFNSHPVNVQSEIKFDQLPFPAVTICNLNPVRKSKLDLAPQLKNLLAACDLQKGAKDGTGPKLKSVDICKKRALYDPLNKDGDEEVAAALDGRTVQP